MAAFCCRVVKLVVKKLLNYSSNSFENDALTTRSAL